MSPPRSTIKVVHVEHKEHYCSLGCESEGEPCGLCLAQRRKLVEDKLRTEGLPTLKYQPFANLKKAKV
jgi:hypothetical protein